MTDTTMTLQYVSYCLLLGFVTPVASEIVSAVGAGFAGFTL